MTRFWPLADPGRAGGQRRRRHRCHHRQRATPSTGPIRSESYATGIDLPNVVTIGADAYGDQVMDVSGQTLTPYSYTFFTTNVAPSIVSSSIDGQVFSPAPADVTEVVTFSQPMNTSFTTSSSFSLDGNYLNVSTRPRRLAGIRPARS